MSDACKELFRTLRKSGIRFAVLDHEPGKIRILVSPNDKDAVNKLLTSMKWQKKQVENEIYLYGMDHFSRFEKDNDYLTVCYQVSCRSTLNGEWVPLDRKINNFAMDGIREDGEYPRLCPEDELCYLLAKCVYTETAFSEDDKKRIKKAIDSVNNELLMPKIEGVFFKFSKRLLTMAKDNRFDEIIPALWSFGEYE